MIKKFNEYVSIIMENIKYDKEKKEVVFIPTNTLLIIQLIKKLKREKKTNFKKLKNNKDSFEQLTDFEKKYLKEKNDMEELYKDVFRSIGNPDNLLVKNVKGIEIPNYQKSLNLHGIKVNTDYFKEDRKTFNYKIMFLQKTTIKVINMYKLDQELSKILKKGVFTTINKRKSNVDFDLFNNDLTNSDIVEELVDNDYTVNEFINKELFLLKNYLYFYKIVKDNMPGVDMIITPSSSSSFNKTFINNIKNKFSNRTIFVDDNFFIKNVKNIQIDHDWLKEKEDDSFYGYDSEDIIKLQKHIKHWIEKVEPKRDKIRMRDQIEKEIDNILKPKKDKQEFRGRKSHKLINLEQQLIIIKELINDIGLRGKVDPTLDEEGNLKN